MAVQGFDVQEFAFPEGESSLYTRLAGAVVGVSQL